MVKRRKVKRMSNVKLKERYGSDNFLEEVRNPRGKKPSVYVYQGMKPGFSAAYLKTNRQLPGSSRSAEALARKLARKGHKKVIFLD